MTQDYKELTFYKMSEDLSVGIYQVTGRFPQSEQRGMTSQLRRASSSIPLNIAEGCGKNTSKELISAFYHALGSAKEVSSALTICFRIGYINKQEFDYLNSKVESVAKMINTYIGKVKGGDQNAPLN